MPILSKPSYFASPNRFAFRGRDVLLKEGGGLPTEADFARFVKSEWADEWFSEEGEAFTYSAMSLVGDAHPQGFHFIPIRQFLFERPCVAHLASRAASILAQRRLFRFCPACGVRLTDDALQTAARCPACERLYFPRIEPATITLVSRGDEILLVKSKTAAYRHFACVSGFVEAGESAEQCVVREIKEEVGLCVKSVRYVGSQAWPFPDQLMLAFTAEWESGEIVIQPQEIECAVWFRRGALPPEGELPRPGSVAWRLINGKFDGVS